MEGIWNKVSDYSPTGFTPGCHSSLSLKGLDTIASVMVSNILGFVVSQKNAPSWVTTTISTLGTQILLPPLLLYSGFTSSPRTGGSQFTRAKQRTVVCALSWALISKKSSQRADCAFSRSFY